MPTPKYSVILPNYLTPQDRFTSYGGTPKNAGELIDLCAKQEVFQGIEIIAGEEESSLNGRNLKEVRSALENNGLTLASVSANIYSGKFQHGSFSSPDPKIRSMAIDTVKQSMDLAAEMGGDFVNQWPGQDGWDYYFEVDYQKAYDLWVEAVQVLADYNPQVRLGIEPKPFEPRCYSLIDSSTKALLLIRDIQRPNVGLTLDIGHALYGHENLGEIAVLAQRDQRLFHLHMNDNYGETDADLPFGSVHLQTYLEFFYWLRRTEYDGYHSVDIFAYRTDPAESVLEGVRWMQAIYDLLDQAGMENLDRLIKEGNGIASQRFMRELIFGK